ncbi:MAG: hypothetical protein J1E65_00900 [Lachnospiraceae bacterium]|nr:hypothetical protein [Lachnospiraceae bacterium]
MTFRKNVFSYLLWAVFTASICIYHIAIVTLFLEQTPLKDAYAQMGVIGLTIVLAAGFFALLRRLVKKQDKEADKHTISHLIWESTLAILLLGAGIFIRACMAGDGTQEAAFFETASITGQPVIPIAHGAQYLYVVVLRGLFFMVGNNFTAGIILQICLQALAAIVWYFGIRRISGTVAALLFLAGTMLLPMSMQEGITYSPKMLYLLLFGLVFLMVGRFLHRQKKGVSLKWYSWIHIVVLGIGIGILTYLDVSGLTLLLPVLFIYGVKEDEAAEKGAKRFLKLSLQVMTVILVFLLTVILLMFLDAMQSNADIIQVFDIWCLLFSYKEMGGVPALLYPNALSGVYAMPLISFLLVLGIPAFFIHEKRESQMLYFFFLAGVAVILAGNFHASGMTAGYLAFSLVLALMGAGVQETLQKSIKEADLAAVKAEDDSKQGAEQDQKDVADKPEAKAKEKKAEKVKKQKPEKKKKAGKVADIPVLAPTAGAQEKRGNYIENPLPLPKKHETKVLDYPYFVATDKLRYDVRVADDDDFDI